MAVKSQEDMTLPAYRETENRTDGYGSDVARVATTSTRVSSPTQPLHATNPFSSPLDQSSHPPQTLPPSQIAEKDEPMTESDDEPQGEWEKMKKKLLGLHPLLRMVVIIVVSPIFMLAAIIYAIGQFFVGVGDLMMCGPLLKKNKKAGRVSREERNVNGQGMV
ncbi:hypothetical protein EIP86_003311 [Pleurotus ostreatoroseus]|nr:hypothetical protein EIP86_003311 [Pleurotus ostreatoroseus]